MCQYPCLGISTLFPIWAFPSNTAFGIGIGFPPSTRQIHNLFNRNKTMWPSLEIRPGWNSTGYQTKSTGLPT